MTTATETRPDVLEHLANFPVRLARVDIEALHPNVSRCGCGDEQKCGPAPIALHSESRRVVSLISLNENSARTVLPDADATGIEHL